MGDKGEGTARDSDSVYSEGDHCPLSAKCFHEMDEKGVATPLMSILTHGMLQEAVLPACNNKERPIVEPRK